MSLQPAVSHKDHVQGSPHTAIELVEYGDYQCPHCGHAYQVVKAMQRKFGTDLRFVFRNFPLSKVHPQATAAAIATEAAAVQGKFWQMHDIIFENQDNLLPSALIRYASQIGLDIDRFDADLHNDALARKVEADFESGIRSGVNRTPGFFINGKKYEGSVEGEALQNYIQASIKAHRENRIPFL